MSSSNIPIRVREILNISLTDIWGIENALYDVTYENGIVVQTKKNQVIFDRYCWELFKAYSNTPIPHTCSIVHIVNNGVYTSNSNIKLLEAIFKHICEYNRIYSYKDKDGLLKAVYSIHNLIFNEIVHRISPYVTTIDATDFIEVVKSPKIVEVQDKIKPNPESIDRTYTQIKSIILDFDNMNNMLAKAYIGKYINEAQANQCIGPRGFVPDLDRTIFKQPIVNGFIKGMGNLYEMMVESRTAAKALNANDTNIRDSEYSSRRIQLLSMVVTNVIYTDCGSTEYIKMYLSPKILSNLKGKYYKKEDGSLGCLTGGETNLLDRFVEVRSTLGCRLLKSTHVCSVCMGEIANNFKDNSNLGYISTAYLMEKASQSILSTKHLTHSVRKSVMRLEGLANKYFVSNETNSIFFNRDLNLEGLTMILSNTKLKNLVDALNTTNPNISLAKIGELDTIIIKDSKHKTPISETVDISYRDRPSIITSHLLNYIKNSSIECDARGNFIVPLANYDKKLPLFNNLLKENDMITFVNKLTSIIENNKDKVDNPYDKLSMLFTHVLEQFNCNMSLLEILIYSTTTYNKYDNNYNLGRNSPHSSTDVRIKIFKNRSLGGLFTYEKQLIELLGKTDEIFIDNNRLEHPMDVLFVPESIVGK